MSKTDEQRFGAAMDTLLSLAQREGMVIYNGYAGVLEWLSQQADPAAAKRTAGAALSLGSHWAESPAITASRDALRALLLVQVTRYAMTGAPLKALKGRASASDHAVARITTVNELKQLCSRIVVRPGGILIDQRVYHWAGVKTIANIAQALRAGRDKGVGLLESAYAYVGRGNDPDGHYARWFGTGDRATVRTNLQRMMDAYRTKAIHIHADEHSGSLSSVYGSATMQGFEQFSAVNYVKVNVGAHFFGQTAQHSQQIVYDAEQVQYMERALAFSAQREQAEKQFFADLRAGGNVDVLEPRLDARKAELTAKIKEQADLLPKGDEKISVAGVILHEVSHNTIATTDVKEAGQTMYGPNLCMWLARNQPGKTLINADNYRLFCEQFMA